MSMIIGVDPGLNGAMAWFSDQEGYGFFNFKNKSKLQIAEQVYTLWTTVLKHHGTLDIFMEKVGVMRHDGRRSASTFGKVTGQIDGMLHMLLVLPTTPLDIHAQIHYVAPVTWQSTLDCLTGGNKNVTKAKAANTFGQLKITHGNADALLICEYGCKILGVGRYAEF